MPRRLDLYPYRFKPILKEKIWGGGRLRSLLGKRARAGQRIGESWELADRGRDMSVVDNGDLRGTSLRTLLAAWPREVLGDEHGLRYAARFPLLVKFLDCDRMLSVQVHPSDEFAARHESGDTGKMEAWVVVRAEEDAVVIRGVLPGTTAAEFHAAAARGTVEPALNRIEVKEGDVIFLPPGTVHAAGGGLVLAEVTQNSDLTYRIYDWKQVDARGRPRPLHIDKAVANIDFRSLGVAKMKPVPIPGQGCRRRLLVKCEKFTLETIEVDGRRARIKHPPDRFRIAVVLHGRGTFAYGEGGRRREPFRAGETFLLPAHLGDFAIAAPGRTKILYAYI